MDEREREREREILAKQYKTEDQIMTLSFYAYLFFNKLKKLFSHVQRAFTFLVSLF